VNDGLLIEVIHGGDEPILEFLFGCYTDVTQNRARKLGEEALEQPARLRISEVKDLCRQLPIRTASISDARGGNEPRSART
jgi:hypothetical protein